MIHLRVSLERCGFRLDVDVDIPNRGVSAVLGPSGSGKTTLLRAIAGLEPRARGRIELGDGRTWLDSDRRVHVPVHRREVGYVPQEAVLFDHLSVRGNLEFGRRRRPGGALDLDRVVAWLGIGELVDRSTVGLSGGERQRVAIARALLAAPRLLLLDEPLSAVDEPSRAEILLYLERLHRELDLPILYVSHSRSEVLRLADHVVILDRGLVVATGPVGTIAARSDLPIFGDDADVGTVADVVVAETDAELELSYLEFAGGRLAVPAIDAAPGGLRRVRLLARDVSLALERPRATSILNVLEARVVEIRQAASAQPIVVLDARGATLLARISRKSLRDLALAPGSAVFAQIKGVALLGSRPGL